MAESINLSDYADKIEEIFEAVIVEDHDGNTKEMSRNALANHDSGNVKKIIPKPMTQDIIDGSSIIARKYLQKEFAYMDEFFKSRGVPNPRLKLDIETQNEWTITVDFPIPNKLKKEDGTFYYRNKNLSTERFLFLINDYPNMPPVGFHVTKDAPKEMIKILEYIFGNHMFNSVAISGVNEKEKKELAKKWTWICFHYGKNKWKFDRKFWENTNDRKMVSKSSLTGYFYYIYYKMIGADVSS